MRVTTTIKKVRKADVEFGDRASVRRKYGQYGVFLNDVQVGFISAGSTGYRERPTWTVSTFKGRLLHTAWTGGFAEAKQFALDYGWFDALMKGDVFKQ